MSSGILVSVVIPVFNVEGFISETIESVLSQTLKDIEVILVDDGSTDKSLIICQEYLNKDSRIKIVKQLNSGVSIARNIGLELAIGEYIFFMDADDTIDFDFLNSSYKVAKQKDFDIVVLGEDCCSRLPNVSALPTWGQFIRHDFLKKHSRIRFPENIQPCEDGLFSHQLLALTQKIGTNPQAKYHYRHHENQNHKKNNDRVDKVLLQIPLWLTILEDFYKEHNLFETHALHLALFMEHEPLELRYFSMPLNPNQKECLHALIVQFMQKNVLPFLGKEDQKVLKKYFLMFIQSKDYSDFDYAFKMLIVKCKIKLFLLRFVPVSKLRKRMRKEIKSNIFK